VELKAIQQLVDFMLSAPGGHGLHRAEQQRGQPQ
jgi:hypothetical protein